MMKKILLIDDHVVVRSGLKGCISEVYKPCDVHEADNGDDTIRLLKQNNYDLVIMDVQIPGSDMLKLMEHVHLTYPDTKVLMFSMSPEDIFAKRFLKAGARGFLSKNSSLEDVTKAIDIVLSGRKYISMAFAEILADDSIASRPLNPIQSLSEREFEIVRLLLDGQTINFISQSLNLHPSTVSTHKFRAFAKLSVTNLLQLEVLFASHNL